MRARQFIFEYSREKTAGVFGKKILAAVAKDRSAGPQLFKQYRTTLNATPINEIDPSILQNIINMVMEGLESADPTANKEYVQWLAKVYANEGVMFEDLTSKTTEWLQRYDLYKKKKFFKDNDSRLANIMNLSWKDMWEISIRADFQMKIQQQQEKVMSKGNAEQVYENDKVRIIVPHDKEAACYYGQGTQWCTASTQSMNYFNAYSKDGPLYILLPKQPKYDGEKYQLHFASGQFMDEQDRNVDDIIELLDMRFGNLVEFFREREPEINDWLVFTPDEVLEPLIAKIKTAVNDHVWEMASEWEAQDDYWYEYLRSKGYVYPEGHEDEGQIDFEKAFDNDESYTSWNYEVSDFIGNINSSVDLTPAEVRDLAMEVGYEWGADTQSITDLDKIFAYSIEQNIRGRDGDGGVAEWIHEHIYIKKRDGKWDVSLLYTQKDGQRKEYEIH